MYINIFLILITLTMTFILGRWSYLLNEHDFHFNYAHNASVENTIHQMINSLDIKGVLDVSGFYEGQDRLKLLDPLSYKNASSLYTTPDCGKIKTATPDNLLHLYDKELLWDKYQCLEIESLPDTFFKYPPYMHPTGHSYAFLFYKNMPSEVGIKWASDNLEYFHLLELNGIKKNNRIVLYDPLAVLGSFNVERILYLSNLSEFILLDDFLLIRKSESSLVYYVYDMADVDKFLKNSHFTIRERTDLSQKCLMSIGNSCWRYSTSYLFQMFGNFSIVLFISTIILLILFIVVLLKNLAKNKRNEELRRQGLQILTHEFRTPASSMILEIENIQQKFSLIDESLHAPVLRLSNSIYRLQRLIEKSTAYLNLSQKNVFKFQLTKVLSINEFIDELLKEFYPTQLENKAIVYCPLERDTYFYFDQHWIGICIKNLIDNAILHGHPPIHYTLLFNNDNNLIISIVDNGKCKFSNIDEMCADYTKSKESKGMGLGLKIVRRIISDMGGKLNYISVPTTFEIILNRTTLERKTNDLRKV